MNRFGDLDWSFKKLPPIFGFHSQDLVSLEQALQPLESQIKELRRYIEIAKDYCHYPNEQNLSKDQSASIYIYTMEWQETSLYRVLNEALRSEDRESLKIWFPYLKLFDTALDRLPTVKGVVWRGVALDVGKNFTKDQAFTWWAVSSCSASVNVIEKFLQNKKDSTLFLIEAINGKKVSGYTQYENEDEIILKIGTEFRVKAEPLKRPDGSHTVHLIEVDEDADDKETSVPKTQEISNINTTQRSELSSVFSSSIYTERNFYLGVGDENNAHVSHPPLTCRGRQCIACGRCCDWYYAGHANDWEWIRKFRDWDKYTVERWRKGDYHDKFKLHSGAKCDRMIYYEVSYIVRFFTDGAFDGSHLIGHLCVCDSPQPSS